MLQKALNVYGFADLTGSTQNGAVVMVLTLSIENPLVSISCEYQGESRRMSYKGVDEIEKAFEFIDSLDILLDFENKLLKNHAESLKEIFIAITYSKPKKSKTMTREKVTKQEAIEDVFKFLNR